MRQLIEVLGQMHFAPPGTRLPHPTVSLIGNKSCNGTPVATNHDLPPGLNPVQKPGEMRLRFVDINLIHVKV